MSEAKTKPTQVSVEQYIAAIVDSERRAEVESLLKLMCQATNQAPVMWGPSIVGFGKYSYSNASGRTGESCAAGFAARKGDISIYLVAEGPSQQVLLSRLGKHKMGKACLSIRRLAEVDLKVLEQLVSESYAEVLRRHPCSDA
ncbi:DUF1801 domain-containing protein [Chitinimonas sp.]|uniref:DUF1801 domain-containing protein n=1 Tax=Chitinimonas sp. TaxID=1934313 RepID=UPI0035B01D95